MSALDLHALLQMTVVALALVACSCLAFRGRPASRRQFSIGAAATLVALPVGVALAPRALWPMGVDAPDALRAWLSLTPPPWMLAVWIGGAGFGLIGAFTAAVRTGRFVAALPPHHARRARQVANDYRHRLGIQAPVDVRACLNAGPCSWPGRPTAIVLPREAVGWPGWVLEAVIVHELVHIARRDAWFALLVRCARAVWWPIPGAGVLAQAFERSAEESCDDRAAAVLDHQNAYASALAWIAVQGVQYRSPMLAAPALATHALVKRIERFLRPRDVLPEPLRVATLLVIVVVSSLFLMAFRPVERPPARIEAIALREPDPLDDATPRTRRIAAQSGGALEVKPVADTPSPVFPGVALSSGIEGSVHLRYRVNRSGFVSNVQIIQSDHALLARAAERALRRTRFEIATDAGGIDAVAIRTERFDYVLPQP